MAKKRIIAMITAAAVLVICWAAAAGDAADPVVSKSYLEGAFTDTLLADVAQRVSAKISNPSARIDAAYSDAAAGISRSGLASAAAEIALEELQARGQHWYRGNMQTVAVKSGLVLCGDAGTKVTLLEGGGEVYGNPVVNVTAGYEYAAGSRVALNNSYFFTANDGSGIRFTADSKVVVSGRYKLLQAVRVPRYTDLAKALERMNLVRGAANGFELYRGATRAEAITMLIRLLAEEDAANRAGLSHHFTDVGAWADSTVAYALNRGYANGVSRTAFGAASPTTANHYMTFLLRALGYSDAAGDFTWDRAMDAARDLGVIGAAEHLRINSTPFTRDHMVYLSYYALFSKVKGTEVTLLESLISRGAVDRAAADAAVASVTRVRG